ncbi:hypothetical protein [Corynebacterium macclintockiae]|uniref:hypothetical protein n=1 Tax=Corynebacterium macclintockiae TaxID=2913501 RepID=UPI003EBFFCC9
MEQRPEHLYVTIDSYIREVVIPSLGEFADDYDVEAIAREMTYWYEETDGQGNLLANHSGLAERDVDDAYYWAVVERYDRS